MSRSVTSPGRYAALFALRRLVVALLVYLLATSNLLSLRELVASPGRVDWARSQTANRAVADLVAERLPATLGLLASGVAVAVLLALAAVLVAVMVTWPVRRWSSLHSFASETGRWLVATWLAVPPLVAALTLAALGGQGAGPLAPIALAILPAGLIARAVMGELAAYEGADHSSRHGRRIAHAAITVPIVALGMAGGWLSGAVLIESVVNRPGVGQLLVQSVFTRDAAVVFGVLGLFVGLTVGAKLLADLLRAIDLLVLDGAESLEDAPPGAEAPAGSAQPRPWLWLSLALCLAVLLLPVAIGLAAPLLAPADPAAQDITRRLAPAGGPGRPLGTDPLGRDVLSRILYAVRTDLLPLLPLLPAILPTAGLGALAGWLARRQTWWADVLDDLAVLPFAVIAAFPALALLLCWVSVVGPALPSLLVILIVAASPAMASQAREIWQGTPSTLGRVLSPLGAYLLGGATAISYLAAAGSLGVGVQPPTPELGTVIGDARQYLNLSQAWLFASVALCLVLFGWLLAAEVLLSRLGVRGRRALFDFYR